MEAIERTWVWPFSLARFDLGSVAAWCLSFAAVSYLGLSNGGYDVIARSEVGIVASWLLLIGGVVGAVRLELRALSGAALALLIGFALWTGVSLLWSSSPERTMIEIARCGALVGVFMLGLVAQERGCWRAVLNGVVAAAVLICGVGVLSELLPRLFDVPQIAAVLPSVAGRLAFPLNYTSGMGGFAAMTVPLALGASLTARSLIGQAAAAAAIPIAAFALWLTASGLALPVVAVGSLVLLALVDRRARLLATALVSGVGSAVLFGALSQRPQLDAGSAGASAVQQGHEMLAILVAVCLAVGLLQISISVISEHSILPSWGRIPRPSLGATVAGLGLAALICFAVLIGSGRLGQAADNFAREPIDDSSVPRAERILDYRSSGRIDIWNSAADAFASEPIRGIGAGTFETWWTRDPDGTGFVRDAHSLYLETLAEEGIIGAGLIGLFSLLVLVGGARSAIRANPAMRTGIATAVAGAAAFVAAASVDWMWELAVMPAVFMLLAAVAVGAHREARSDPADRQGQTRNLAGRGLAILIGLAVFGFSAIVLGGSRELQQSQADFNQGNVTGALERARAGLAVQPYSSSLLIQQSLLLSDLDRGGAAVGSALKATVQDPLDWRTWYVLSQVQSQAGMTSESASSLRQARTLNPRSAVFQ